MAQVNNRIPEDALGTWRKFSSRDLAGGGTILHSQVHL